MTPVLVISPHFDDAVLSLGQFLAGRPDAVVATVCTEPPADLMMSTGFDTQCGFTSALDAVTVRGVENGQALAVVHARDEPLGFVDSQYGQRLPVPEVAAAIGLMVDAVRPDFVAAPLGLKHPDHEVTSDAAIAACKASGATLWLYEELPYRVEWPEQVWARLNELGRRGVDLARGFIGEGPKGTKRRALQRYGSQLWALDLDCVYVPERVWLVT